MYDAYRRHNQVAAPSLRQLTISIFFNPFTLLHPISAVHTVTVCTALRNMSSTKQWALITGASEGGIGDSLAREFAKNGVGVIASSRTTAKMQHLATVEGIETLQLDVSSAQSIRTAVEEVTRLTGGRLDYLVNNAGKIRFIR